MRNLFLGDIYSRMKSLLEQELTDANTKTFHLLFTGFQLAAGQSNRVK